MLKGRLVTETIATIDRKQQTYGDKLKTSSIVVQFSCEFLESLIGQNFKIVKFENLYSLDKPINITVEVIDG